mmetsp:Transcript_23023/g.87026  ORF Transcript_23023/g.87026 Transcript_23023/m.87026 type:complete len:296 (+) Transcript_23023:285-1172(+)
MATFSPILVLHFPLCWAGEPRRALPRMAAVCEAGLDVAGTSGLGCAVRRGPLGPSPLVVLLPLRSFSGTENRAGGRAASAGCCPVSCECVSGVPILGARNGRWAVALAAVGSVVEALCQSGPRFNAAARKPLPPCATLQPLNRQHGRASQHDLLASVWPCCGSLSRVRQLHQGAPALGAQRPRRPALHPSCGWVDACWRRSARPSGVRPAHQVHHCAPKHQVPLRVCQQQRANPHHQGLASARSVGRRARASPRAGPPDPGASWRRRVAIARRRRHHHHHPVPAVRHHRQGAGRR